MTQGGGHVAAVIDAIYRPWRQRQAGARGLFDRERRFPGYLIGIADQLGWLPDPERTVRVTGSKGKGSVARLIAWSLQAAGHRVGMVLSPHERDNTDRLRIDNQAISPDELVAAFARLAPSLKALLESHPAPYYPAPSGLFLLLGLAWFKDQGVDYWVLEAGRGGVSDELGPVPSKLAVVSALLDEHLDCLGPGMAELAREKLDIGLNAEKLIVSGSVDETARQHGVQRPGNAKVVDARVVDGPGQGWRNQVRALAGEALEQLDPRASLVGLALPSGALHQLPDGELRLLPWVNPASIEAEALSPRCINVLGLSEDKPAEALLRQLHKHGVCHTLTFAPANRDSVTSHADETLGVVDLQGNGEDLKARLAPLFASHEGVNLIGNQQLLSLARRAWEIPLAGPRP